MTLVRTVRPWGWYENLAEGDHYLVKRLWIETDQRISLQRHRHRSEHWVVVSGQGEVDMEGKRFSITPGSTVFIPTGAVHRATACASPLEIIEVQRGDELREDDIERLADDYGRLPA